MITKGRWAAVTLAASIAAALLGCPSLRSIGVTGGDAGDEGIVEAARADARSDARDADGAKEAHACTPDAASDPRNCGRCGHDCMGGACEGGVCQAYVLATDPAGTYGVAVNGGVVYFTSIDGTVQKCTADDCAMTLTQMTSGQGTPRAITTDSTSVYWANEGFIVEAGFLGGIATCGLAGCPKGTAMVLASAEVAPIDVAVNTNAVFWTDEYGKLVRSCSIGGCGNMPTTLATDPTNLSGVAIDATSIYWAETQLGNIIQCPLGGCTSFVPLASFTPYQFTKLDIANDTVFWSTDGEILSCATSGCGGTPQVFATGQANAYAVAHDATNLYWTLFDASGSVLSCPLAGCSTPTVLATMQIQPTSVAVDDISVYWANSGGTVMRVMK
jgi:hypothetical protein